MMMIEMILRWWWSWFLANLPTTIFQRLSWSAADCTIYEGDETGGKVNLSLTNITLLITIMVIILSITIIITRCCSRSPTTTYATEQFSTRTGWKSQPATAGKCSPCSRYMLFLTVAVEINWWQLTIIEILTNFNTGITWQSSSIVFLLDIVCQSLFTQIYSIYTVYMINIKVVLSQQN